MFFLFKQLIIGYIRYKIKNINVINDIILELILLFYGYNVTFNIFDKEYIKLNNNIGNIIEMYINQDALFCLTKSGKIYIMGNDNSVGQLGLGKYRDDTDGKFVDSGFNSTEMKFVSSGISSQHGFMLTQLNQLFGFGTNEYNQVGYNNDNQCIYTPKLIHYKFDSILYNIKCGSDHTIFLTLNGIIYGCGSNDMGQLSLYNQDKNYLITKLTDFKNINQIGCCEDTTIIFNKMDNIITTFGDNTLGQLGIGNRIESRMNKIIMEYNVNIINTGQNHIGIVCDNGYIYMFGDNTYFQCTGDNTSIKSPMKININNNSQCIDVKCGNNHTIIKTLSNNYYAFGKNHLNQCLLHENTSYDFVSQPYCISTSNLLNKLDSKNTIIDILPGYDQTYILQKI